MDRPTSTACTYVGLTRTNALAKFLSRMAPPAGPFASKALRMGKTGAAIAEGASPDQLSHIDVPS